VSWQLVTDNWRMKLLAFALAVLLLGAVAFSQNPPTSKSLTLSLVYVKQPPNVILINYPTKTSVTVSGLADLISTVNINNVIASVDLSRAHVGPAVTLPVSVSTPQGISVQTPPPPIAVYIDTLLGKDVPVTVNAHAASGWTITKHDAVCGPSGSCTVHFTGPASWETNLQATVDFPGLVNVSSINSANWRVQLQNSNGPIDLQSCRTLPCVNLDLTTVAVHIEAVPGSTSTSVALLDSPPSHPPANGYRITGVTVTPNTVIVSGDPVTLGKIRNIQLLPQDLSGRTSDATFQVQVQCPAAADSCTPATATLKYSIAPNPNVTPSP
jgi:YbbR domain-containing protein